jgi:hypothetical protein
VAQLALSQDASEPARSGIGHWFLGGSDVIETNEWNGSRSGFPKIRKF